MDETPDLYIPKIMGILDTCPFDNIFRKRRKKREGREDESKET